MDANRGLHNTCMHAEVCPHTYTWIWITPIQKEPCSKDASYHCGMRLIVQSELSFLVMCIIIHRIFFIHIILIYAVGYKNVNYCIFNVIYLDKFNSPFFFFFLLLLPSGPTKTFSWELCQTLPGFLGIFWDGETESADVKNNCPTSCPCPSYS